MTGPAQYAKLKKYMTDGNLTYTDEWLKACYEWICESHPINTLTDKFIQQQIGVQWRDSNLEEMESICLPPNLKAERKVALAGCYALQVNSFKDIGESAYSQYLKVKKLDNENTNVQASDGGQPMASWQPKPRRCLYLTLTDGSQVIYGMELDPIPGLSELKPGCKVMVTGPVDCRRGVLHLKPQNLTFLGGEVEDLVCQNSVENVLSNALSEPKPKEKISQRPPRKVSSKLKEIAKKRKADDKPPTQKPDGGGSLTQSTITSFLTTRTQGISATTTSISSTPATQPIHHLGTASATPVTQLLPTNNPDNEFNSSDDDIFLDENLMMQMNTASLPGPPSTPPLPSLTPPPPVKAPVVITIGDSPVQPSASLKVKVKAPTRKKVSADPYQYIKQIKYGQFKVGDIVSVKAIVATLASNIQIDKTSGEWKLSVNINDGSGFLILGIASTVLDKIIGLTPSQVKQLKASKNARDKAKVNEGFQKMTASLVHFSGIMRIKICEQEKQIIEMLEITSDHVLELVTRTAAFSS